MKKETIEEFLKRGGKIEKVKPGAAAVLGSLDKSKMPHYDNDDIKKGRKGTATRPDSVSYTHLRAHET